MAYNSAKHTATVVLVVCVGVAATQSGDAAAPNPPSSHVPHAVPAAAAAPAPSTSSEWIVTFAKQYGQYVSGMAGGQAELFTFDGPTGKAVSDAPLTNRYNNDTGIFGHGDANGDLRVTFSAANKEYDFHVCCDPSAPGAPSQSTPDFLWEGSWLPHSQDYRMEAHFVRVPTGSVVKTAPFDPVFTYDLIRGFNTASAQVPNFDSDQFQISTWASYQAQTFVVPDGINRIVAAKAFCVRAISQPRFTMNATVHVGSPTGPQVGPASVSRQVFSNEFEGVVMSWPMDAVAVTPGQTYALKVSSVDGKGFNVYETVADNYKSGQLYNGAVGVPSHDMVGMVIGVGVNE